MKKINIDNIIEKVHNVVKSHYIGNGAYARYLWQNKTNSRKMGINEYGCADAMNILYTINQFPNGKAREEALAALLSLQEAKTGLFIEETHHHIHTTAHCVAAIELFDTVPTHHVNALDRYFTKEGLKELIDGLHWLDNPWPQSHQGAGIYTIGVLTDSVDLDWQNFYFDYIYENTDPDWGMSRKGCIDEKIAPAYAHLNGWFHYMFNMQYAKKPLKYPDKLIDTCLMLYREHRLRSDFAHFIGFCEIDWVFAINRATRETPHRFNEVKEAIYDFGKEFIEYLNTLDFETDDYVNDLHMLFGTVCALAELQTALPGIIETSKPLRLVLDRRPFI